MTEYRPGAPACCGKMARKLLDRHENENRIRTYEECVCGVVWYGCFAKRTDRAGGWGPVGVWTYVMRGPME